ncbi:MULTISPECIES: ATP-binding protein [unclassified Streptomyces]|uniref:ATP-binding protein n=1 Tax=unclassified Streptomyces TaxID=2593676 RepID=UPI0011E6D7CE|nr:ATP-binding protein [Streptomyces sp. sk2.1]
MMLPLPAHPDHLSWALPSIRGSVQAARDRSGQWLHRAGIAPDSTLFDAALQVVAELVSNAVQHADLSPDVQVSLALEGYLLTISVGDQDPRPVSLKDLAPRQGLAVVSGLAHDYSGDVRTEPACDGPGKSVIVRFALLGAIE